MRWLRILEVPRTQNKLERETQPWSQLMGSRTTSPTSHLTAGASMPLYKMLQKFYTPKQGAGSRQDSHSFILQPIYDSFRDFK
eukprot:2068568-Amphidinium_carterae.1